MLLSLAALWLKLMLFFYALILSDDCFTFSACRDRRRHALPGWDFRPYGSGVAAERSALPRQHGNHLRDCTGLGIMSLTKDEPRKCKHASRKAASEKDAEESFLPRRPACAEDVLGRLYLVGKFVCR